MVVLMFEIHPEMWSCFWFAFFVSVCNSFRCFHLALSIIKALPPLKEPILGILPVTKHLSIYTIQSRTGEITIGWVHILLGLLLDSAQNCMSPTLLSGSWWHVEFPGISKISELVSEKFPEDLAISLSQGHCQSGKRALAPPGKAQGEKSQYVPVVMLPASLSIEGLYIRELVRSGIQVTVCEFQLWWLELLFCPVDPEVFLL